MTTITLIAAIDEHNGLGKGNQLLCHLPADLKFFKEMTMGKPILMGRNTFESIGKALPGRLNVVLSRTMSTPPSDITIIPSLEAALHQLADYPEVVIIGGATVYEQALPFTSLIYLTKIHHQFEADVFFPQLDTNQWNIELIKEQAVDEKNKYRLSFYKYIRTVNIGNNYLSI